MTPEREANIKRVLSMRQPDLAVLMEDVEDPHNIFAIMRTCDAVGVQDLYIINTKFRRHRKHGKRSSSSAKKWVTVHEFEDKQACIKEIRQKYDKILATYLDDEATSYYDIDYTQSLVLAFGNERFGISDELLKECDGTFYIPQAGMIKSLNVSVACAVTLYEAKRQRVEKGYYNGNTRLPDIQWQELYGKWSIKERNK